MDYNEIPSVLTRLNIIPIHHDSKKPAVKWEEYQKKRFPQEKMQAWDGNFAVLCGFISNWLVVVDFDSAALYEKFFNNIETFTVKTPHGGYHLYFYCKNINKKIPKFEGYPLDVQSEGSYVLIPPSQLEGINYGVVKNVEIKECDDVLAILREHLPRLAERPSDISEFKQLLDISVVIQRYVVQANQGKGYWQGLCPFHEERHPSFTVYKDSYYCFSCGGAGDVINFIMEIEHLSFKEAIDFLCLEYNLPNPYGKPQVERLWFDEKGKPIYETFVSEAMTTYRFSTMSDNEEIYWYSDGYYREGAEVRIKEWVEKKFEEIAHFPCKSAFVNEVIEAVKRRTYTDRELFNSQKKLNLRNGVLLISTREIIPHSPELYFTYQLVTEYNKDAESPLFENFLLQILDPADISIIQEMFGYSLYQGNEFQKAFLLVGSGTNGKSTLLNTLSSMVGIQNIASETLQDLSMGRFAVASLYGKLANICADIPSNPLSYTGKFKMLTGGDVLKGERKFQNPFSFTNTAKLIFSCNQLPQVQDQTPAFWRRWIVVNFPNSFEGKENPYLLMELTKELSGVFNFSLAGLERLLANRGFSRPTTMEDIMEEWKKKADSVYYFATEMLEKNPLSVVTKDDLYGAYCDFCEEFSLISVAKNEFGKRLPQYLRVKPVRKVMEGRVKHCWQGAGLKTT